MGLGDFFRTILKVGAAVPGPWQVPAAIGSAGVGMMDRSGATGYGPNGQKLPSPYAPGGAWDPKQFDHPPGWEGAGSANAMGGGIPGAPQGPAGAFGYAGVPSLSQLDSEWRGMRSGAGAFGTPNGVIGPPIPMGNDLGKRGGFMGGAGGGILAALGPLGLQLLLKQLSKGKKLPKGFKWPGGAKNNPNSPDETADTGGGSDYYDPYMDDNSGGSVADFDPSGGGTSDFYTPDISAASGLPPTYLPSGANITAHPGEVAQVIPADQVASASPDPLSLPPGEPGPQGTPSPVQPSDLAFEQNQQGGGQDSGPTPPPIAPEHGAGISKALLSYLPLILGGGGMLAMAARASKKNPPPPGQSSQLHSAFQGLVEGYAGGKLNNALANRRSQMEQQEFLVKEAHRAVMDARGVNWDNAAIPPATKQRFQELNQKYTQALSKDSPGGSLITTGEAAEIVAIKASLDQALGQSGQAREVAGKEASLAIPFGGDVEAYRDYEKQIRSGKVPIQINAAQARGLGHPELEGIAMSAAVYAKLLDAVNAGHQIKQVAGPTGAPEWHVMDPRSGQDLGPVGGVGGTAYAPVKLPNQTISNVDRATGQVTSQTVAGGFARPPGARPGGAPPSAEGGIAPPPSPRPASGGEALSAPPSTSDQRVVRVKGRVSGVKALPETAVANVEALDMGRSTLARLKTIIAEAGLQNENNPIGPKFEKLLYSHGIDPGELDRQVNQLSGLGLANMLSSFSGRFRNAQYMNILTGHMPQGGMSYKMLYNMANDLLPYVAYKRKQIYKLHSIPEMPYEEPDLGEGDITPPPGEPPSGSAEAAKKKFGVTY